MTVGFPNSGSVNRQGRPAGAVAVGRLEPERPARARSSRPALAVFIGTARFELATFGPPDRRANQAAPRPAARPRYRRRPVVLLTPQWSLAGTPPALDLVRRPLGGSVCKSGAR